jgi:hypothetical protein
VRDAPELLDLLVLRVDLEGLAQDLLGLGGPLRLLEGLGAGEPILDRGVAPLDLLLLDEPARRGQRLALAVPVQGLGERLFGPLDLAFAEQLLAAPARGGLPSGLSAFR